MTQPKPIEHGELPKELAARVITDMQRLQTEGRPGYANPSQLARTLGVSQPSARAWFTGRAQPSFEIAKRFSELTKIEYPELSGVGGEGALKWRALVTLVRLDKLDPNACFTVLESMQLDRSIKNPTWGEFYELARRAVTGQTDSAPELQPPASGAKAGRSTFPPETSDLLEREIEEIQKPNDVPRRKRARK